MSITEAELNLLARIHMKKKVSLPPDEYRSLLDPESPLIEVGPAGHYVLTAKGRELLIDKGRLASAW
ncbi:hypothetical protein [Paludibacterium yongneupense]|uniref:hypothetical protein n=1 Tax=Paludibacterium yongneupense TaxID=400061 RepID=UPI00041B35AC|nr:hypothetical protein [Paludibacterium yongneupense]